MENNLGPNAPLPTKKGLEAIRRRNVAAAVAAKKPSKVPPPLSKLAGTGATKAATTVKKLIGPVSPLAAGELPPVVATAAATHDDPFADAPVNHVAEHLADPYSRFGSQLRYLRRHLARYKTSRPLLDAIDAIHRGENLHGNVQRLQSALAVLRKGKVSDSHLSEHIKAMHDGYNWDTLAGNLEADARLSSHINAGGKAEDVSHLYANDAEFQRALLRRRDYEDDKQFLAGTGKHTSEKEGADDIGEVTRKTESPASYLRYVEETWGDRKHHARLARRSDLSPAMSAPLLTAFNRQKRKNYAPLAALVDKLQEQWPHAPHLPIAAHVIMHPDTVYTSGGRSLGGAKHSILYGVHREEDGSPSHRLTFFTPGKFHRFTLPITSIADFEEAHESSKNNDGSLGTTLPREDFDLSRLRLSRVGDPELRELHHMRTLTPDVVVADKIQENGWEHDEHTLDLLRGEHPIPPGHHLHVARHPGTRKIVAWHDEYPIHIRSVPGVAHVRMHHVTDPTVDPRHVGPSTAWRSVVHGPGGAHAVWELQNYHGRGAAPFYTTPLDPLGWMDEGLTSHPHETQEAAHAAATAAAFPRERPVVRMSMVSRVAKAVGMAGGAYLGHALGGHMGDFAGGIAGSLGASSTPTEGWPMVGAAAGGMIGHALHPYITPLLTRLKNLIIRRKQTAGRQMSAKTAALLTQAEKHVAVVDGVAKQRGESDAVQSLKPEDAKLIDQTHRESFRGAMKYLGYPDGEDRRNPEALEAWRLNAHPEVHAAATAAKSATDLESKRHMFRHFLGVVRKHVGLLQHHGYLPLPPAAPEKPEALVGVQSREGRVNELLKYLRGPQPMLLHTDGNPKLGPDAAEPTPGAMKRIAARDAAGKGKLPKRRKAKDHFQEFK